MNDSHPLGMALIATALICVTGAAAPARATVTPTPTVDLAILLDTSGSMSGLIDQARTQLWKIVNEFQTAKRGDLQPNLRVALYEYGKGTLPRQNGFIRQITPLSSDLDRVSEELFALRTNGGDEHCGQAVQSAVRGLQWSGGEGDLRMIFIAGNEPFTQGPVDWRRAIAEANRKDITVHTLHCGRDADASRGGWNAAAELAGGSFLNINHNMKVAHVTAPQDAEIERLGRQLNDTYLAFGAAGAGRKARQAAQDSNAAAAAPGSMTERAVAKASRLYDNSDWDLLDAAQGGKVSVADLEEEALPEAMHGMNASQRQAFIDGKRAERVKLQGQIAKLNAERKTHVAKERAAVGSEADDSLDSAVRKAVRDQAASAGYTF